MKTTLLIKATLGILAFLTLSAQAEEACKAEFRQSLTTYNSVFPYEYNITSEYSGKITKAKSIVYSPTKSVTFSSNEFWFAVNEQATYQSTDQGAHWKKTLTLPTDHWEKTAAIMNKQADDATDLICKDGVSHNGKNYRLIQANTITANGTNTPVKFSFFVDNSGVWQVSIAELMIAGELSVVVSAKTKQGEGVQLIDFK